MRQCLKWLVFVGAYKFTLCANSGKSWGIPPLRVLETSLRVCLLTGVSLLIGVCLLIGELSSTNRGVSSSRGCLLIGVCLLIGGVF